MNRRTLLQLAGLSSLVHSKVFAQEKYPMKPITLVCPYAAGGSADQRARQIGKFLSVTLGQPVVVDNKPGAGGNIGTELVAKAKPDGYVLGMGNFAPLAVNKHMFAKMGYDPLKDLTPICLIERGPLVLMVPLSSPYKSVKDIIAAAQAKPGALTFASGGLGGSHQLSAEMFKSISGISITHVPYRGGSLATTDLIGGQVNMMFEQMYAAAPSIKANKLRPLAITSAKRSPLFPEIPTMQEAGVAGFDVLNWQGLIGPPGLPKELIKLLNKTVNAALADTQIKEQMLSQGNEIGGGEPEAFAAFINSESARWGKIVRSAGIKPE